MLLFQLANAEAELTVRIDTLNAAGVSFLICNNTLTERKIDWHASTA